MIRLKGDLNEDGTRVEKQSRRAIPNSATTQGLPVEVHMIDPGKETPTRDRNNHILFLDFQFDRDGGCICITRSILPFSDPDSIVAAFSENAFSAPEAASAWIDLLYALENEIDNWKERRSRHSRRSEKSGVSTSDQSRFVYVTRIRTMNEFHRALELILATANALVLASSRAKESEGDPCLS
jgi:hypothetical protein